MDTPILFLFFNRPKLTETVFDQIRRVKPKFLYIATDGPKLNVVTDVQDCNEARNIVNKIDWECELKLLFREHNLGCGLAVSSAINWFFDVVEFGINLITFEIIKSFGFTLMKNHTFF